MFQVKTDNIHENVFYTQILCTQLYECNFFLSLIHIYLASEYINIAILYFANSIKIAYLCTKNYVENNIKNSYLTKQYFNCHYFNFLLYIYFLHLIHSYVSSFINYNIPIIGQLYKAHQLLYCIIQRPSRKSLRPVVVVYETGVKSMITLFGKGKPLPVISINFLRFCI